MPAKKESEDRLTAAEERVAELSGGPIDISFLLNGDAPEAWNDADDALRRDLFGLAVEQITVTRAPKQGVRFKGDERVTIDWANPVQVEELAQAA